MKSKRAFTLTELLVVIVIIASLLAILLPFLAKARLHAKILVTDAELSDIGLALEAYGMDNKNVFPPTRVDCNPDARPYMYALPQELVKSGYLPGGKIGSITFSRMEDKFNSNLPYKYITPGPRYSNYGSILTPMADMLLQVPDGFPDHESETYNFYNNQKTSPVTWILFSYGPKFDENNWVQDMFPVSKKFWYKPKTGSGIITRLRLLGNIRHIGTFRKN